jgi:hypothetical protein
VVAEAVQAVMAVTEVVLPVALEVQEAIQEQLGVMLDKVPVLMDPVVNLPGAEVVGETTVVPEVPVEAVAEQVHKVLEVVVLPTVAVVAEVLVQFRVPEHTQVGLAVQV